MPDVLDEPPARLPAVSYLDLHAEDGEDRRSASTNPLWAWLLVMLVAFSAGAACATASSDTDTIRSVLTVVILAGSAVMQVRPRVPFGQRLILLLGSLAAVAVSGCAGALLGAVIRSSGLV